MKYTKITLVCFMIMLLAIVGCKPPGSSKASDPWDGHYQDNEYVVPEAGPEDYVNDYSTVWKRLPGHFPDPRKDNSTSNMCWAMTAGALLEYTGWAADADDVVNILLQQYGNIPGSAITATNWYFKNYIPGENINHYRVIEHDVIDVPAFMASSIENGKPVSLFLYGKDYNHVIAVYGYMYNPELDQFHFLTVQGDDAVHTKELIVKWNGDKWQKVWGYPNLHSIGSAFNLMPKPEV